MNHTPGLESPGSTQYAFEGMSNLGPNRCRGGMGQEIPMPEIGVEVADHTYRGGIHKASLSSMTHSDFLT